MADANQEEVKRRQSRFFLYQDGKHVVIGSMKVRYEPNLDKNIFGSIEVVTLFPKKKEWKNSFQLDLFPTVQDLKTGDPTRNIIKDVQEGVNLLWIEANRAAGVQSRAVTGLKKEEFSYDNLTILTEDQVTPTETGFMLDAYVLDGKITQKIPTLPWLKPGDLIKVKDCDSDDEVNPFTGESKSRTIWKICYNGKINKFSFVDKFRKFWWSHFKKDLYQKRFSEITCLDIEPQFVWVTSGKPVEHGTARED